MIIKCTSKALPLFSGAVQESPKSLELPMFNSPEAISCWSVNYFEVEETTDKFLLFFNEYVYTPIVFSVNENFDPGNFVELFHDSIRFTWRSYGVPQSFIDAYLKQNENLSCSKLQDRASIGKLNSAIRDFRYSDDELDTVSPFQEYLTYTYKKQMFKPSKGFKISDSAYQYELYSKWATAKNIEAGNYQHSDFPFYGIELEYVESDERVLRKIEIPEYISFEKLHQYIQVVFQWDDYHMWDFLVVSKKGVNKPAARRLRSDNPFIPDIELEAIDVQPEVDYVFDPKLKLKPLARIKPDSEDKLDWMTDGVTNYFPSMILTSILDEEDRAIYNYDMGVGHTIRLHITKRFSKDNELVVCTEAKGDARGEDGNLPLISVEGTINAESYDPNSIPPLLKPLLLSDDIRNETIKRFGGSENFLLAMLNERLRSASWY